MEYQSIGQVLQSILMITGVLAVIFYGLGVLGFAFIYFISSLISLIYIFVVYTWKFSFWKIEIDFDFWNLQLKKHYLLV